MKLDSAYFNMLRTKPNHSKEEPLASTQNCEHAGCLNAGVYRAPKQQSRTAVKQWKFFCTQHISAYNQAYDYFAHMSQEEIIAFQKSAIIGHRPTWRLGARGPKRIPKRIIDSMFHDPFNLFEQARYYKVGQARSQKILQQKTKALTRALHVLELSQSADLKKIRTQFKKLVKRYHPDLNGGKRKYEHRLSAVIQSYHQLKTGLSKKEVSR